MPSSTLIYLFVVGGAWLGVIAVVLAIAIPLIRWMLRINDMVRNQERIISELQRINANTTPDA